MADPLPHERLFYEVTWRHWERADAYPLPWWVQQCFRRWPREWDRGRFATKEGAFAANPLYRYWNMVGVKDHRHKTLIGQAGEVEPGDGRYSLAFFLFEPARRVLHLPQLGDPSVPEPELRQDMLAGFLPVLVTTYRTSADLTVEQRTLGVPVGPRRREIVLNRLTVRPCGPRPRPCWLCLAVLPFGPAGLQRHDRDGRYLADRRLGFLRYLPDEYRVEAGPGWGPVFDPERPPVCLGVYGNPEPRDDPLHYLVNDPFHDLAEHGRLNGADAATDFFGGLCSAVFGWPVDPAGTPTPLRVDVRLPVDHFEPGDLAEIRAEPADRLERTTEGWWREKLAGQGLQPELPPRVAHLADLYRLCRATLLMLSDDGALRPGPTDPRPFRVRDAAVAAIACALAGDSGLAARQLGEHLPGVFNLGGDQVGPAR
ncbi:MAG TPA: hypothetical protein VKP11_03825, partial [Frankiaceae bacterium]|nr:hypothetical protein [Frankiaceae bacterium]